MSFFSMSMTQRGVPFVRRLTDDIVKFIDAILAC